MKKKISDFDFALPLRHLTGITFLIVIILTCTQVIMRYVFNNSLVWSEELVKFLVVWMCLVGSGVSNFDDDHMTINTLVEKLPVKVQFISYTIRQILIVVFCLASSYSSIPLLKAAGNQILGAIPVPAYTWRLSATVGLFIMAILTVLRWFVDLEKFRNGAFCLKDSDTVVAEENDGAVVKQLQEEK